MAFLGLGKKDEELPASFGVGAATDERLVPRGVVVAVTTDQKLTRMPE